MLFTHKPLEIPLPELSAETGPNGRYYTTPDGNVYPSITTCLSILSKEHLDAWRKKIGQAEAKAISEHASNRGTELHACLEDYLANRDVTFPEDKKSKVRVMFNRVKRTLASSVTSIVAQEVPLYSDALKLAGRCDVIGEWNSVPSIIDFKGSTKAKKKEWITGYFMQATAYSVMFEERTGRRHENLVIVMSGEDDFSAQIFTGHRQDYVHQLEDVRRQYLKDNGI